MNRREALKKVAILLGGTLSAPTLMAMSRWEQKTIPNTYGTSRNNRERVVNL